MLYKTLLAVSFSIASLPLAADEIIDPRWDRMTDSVVLFDPTDGVAIACPERGDVYYFEAVMQDAVEQLRAEGTPPSLAAMGEIDEAGCLPLLKGSSGRVTSDEKGHVMVHVDVAELGGDNYLLDVGWYYVRANAIRTDIDTIWRPD